MANQYTPFEELETRDAKINRIEPSPDKFVLTKIVINAGVEKEVKYKDYKEIVECAKNRYEMALEEGADPLNTLTIEQLYGNYMHLYKTYRGVI